MVHYSDIEKLAAQQELIPLSREQELLQLAEIVTRQLEECDEVKIVFICTHNSRRSQLAELWMRAASQYYGIAEVHTYSGGTEETAFNPRMIAALSRYGFTVEQLTEGDNPRYHVPLVGDIDTPIMFSKIYNHSNNPQKGYIAVMVCDQAAEACPIVSGAVERIPLMYIDPKAHDDQPSEAKAYDETVREIGREMIYVAQLIAKVDA